MNSRSSHQFKILNKGISALEARLKLIENAKESIEIEYFIYNTDSSSRIFTQALIEKAKQGVKVRILLDHFLAVGEITPFHIHEMKKHGVEVRYYNNVPKIHLGKYQYRDHRKIFLVDNEYAILGGRNISNEYFDLDEEFNFVDRDVLISGEIVADLAVMFDEYWEHDLSVDVQRARKPSFRSLKYRRGGRIHRMRNYMVFRSDRRKWKEGAVSAKKFLKVKRRDKILREKVAELGTKVLEDEFESTCNNISIVSDRPGSGKVMLSRAILSPYILDKMKNIKKKLVIDSPYFILDQAKAEVIKDLLDSGKKVDILTNGLFSTDAIHVASVFNSKITGWLRKGLTATVFKGEHLTGYKTLRKKINKARWGVHSKSMIFDDDTLMIGSYNVDPRSANYSREISVFCEGSKDIVNSLLENIEYRKKHGTLLKNHQDVVKQEYVNVPFFKRVAYFLIALPSSWLQHLL